jgi:hypothetical protein
MSTALQARLEAARTKKTVDDLIRRTNEMVIAVQPTLEANGDYNLLQQVITDINDGRFSSVEEVVQHVSNILS